MTQKKTEKQKYSPSSVVLVAVAFIIFVVVSIGKSPLLSALSFGLIFSILWADQLLQLEQEEVSRQC